MGTILQLLSLTDRYERKARLLPALIVALPLAIAAGTAVPTIPAMAKATATLATRKVGMANISRVRSDRSVNWE